MAVVSFCDALLPVTWILGGVCYNDKTADNPHSGKQGLLFTINKLPGAG